MPAPVAPPIPDRRPVRGLDATSLLTVFLVLLVGIPSVFVFGPLGAAGRPAGLFAMLLGIIWVLARLVPGSGLAGGHQPVRVVAVGFLLVVLASYIVATAAPFRFDDLSAADRGVLQAIGLVGLTLFTADALVDRERVVVLLRRVVTAAEFMAVIGVAQFLVGFDAYRYFRIPGLRPNSEYVAFYHSSGFRRVASTAGHPIEFGAVMAMILPLALHFAFFSEPEHRRRRWAGVGLIAVAIPMSLSRSAVLGTTVGLVLLLASWTPEQRKRVLTALPFFMVAVRIAVPGLLGTIVSAFQHISGDPSFQGRNERRAMVGHFIARHPYFGRGFGTFDPAKYVLLDNAYVGTIVQLGYVGLSILVLIFAVGFFCARGARRRATDARERDLAGALAVAIAVPAVEFVTFDAFFYAIISGMLFLLVGCAGALWRISREGAGTPLSERIAGSEGRDAVGRQAVAASR